MSGLVCQSCMKQKAELQSQKSTLFKDMTLLLCKSCITAKFEPRGLIIVYGRQNGFASVAHLLAPKQRYVGEPIIAADLIKFSK